LNKADIIIWSWNEEAMDPRMMRSFGSMTCLMGLGFRGGRGSYGHPRMMRSFGSMTCLMGLGWGGERKLWESKDEKLWVHDLFDGFRV